MMIILASSCHHVMMSLVLVLLVSWVELMVVVDQVDYHFYLQNNFIDCDLIQVLLLTKLVNYLL